MVQILKPGEYDPFDGYGHLFSAEDKILRLSMLPPVSMIITDSILDCIIDQVVETCHFRKVLEYQDSYSFNHSLQLTSLAICWPLMQQDK